MSLAQCGWSWTMFVVKKERIGGWRDGSAVKSTDCSSRGPEFNSQQPHGDSQPSIMRSGALFWPCSHTYRQNIIYIINNSFFKIKQNKTPKTKTQNQNKKNKKQTLSFPFYHIKQNPTKYCRYIIVLIIINIILQ